MIKNNAYIDKWYIRLLRKLFWLLPIWYKKRIGHGVRSEVAYSKTEGKWCYSFNKDGNCIGMCLTDFDTDDDNDSAYKNSIVVLGRKDENNTG